MAGKSSPQVEMWMDITTIERQVAPKMVAIQPISHIESAVIIVNLRYQGSNCAISSDKTTSSTS